MRVNKGWKEKLNIERKTKHAYYFKEESIFNYEEYTWKLHTMFQQLTNIGDPIRTAVEVSYPINGIKASNDDTSMGKAQWRPTELERNYILSQQ